MLEGEYSSRMQRNALEGFLHGSNIIFTLDPGADISIVPIEVVPSIFKTGRVKKIRGYDNSVRAVETAEIDIGGFKLKREAGLLSFADLEGTAILSFDNFDRKNHDIYNDLMELKRSQAGCTIPIESGVVHCTKPEGSCKDSGEKRFCLTKKLLMIQCIQIFQKCLKILQKSSLSQILGTLMALVLEKALAI